MDDYRITVVLVDDHRLILGGLEQLLSNYNDIQILSKCTSAQDAYDFVQANEVDIVITDLDMPNMNGIDMIKKVRKIKPDQKILVLSMMSENVIINRMVRYNVNGYLLKNEAQSELKTAIDAIMNGETYYNKEIKEALFMSFSDSAEKSTNGSIPRLSKREREVLELVAKENTTAEIADQLFIIKGMVMTHGKHVLSKLEVKNTAGLIRRAFELGYIR